MRKKKTYNAFSDQPAALAARQREHRLRKRVEPLERASAGADPWLIADAALDHLEEALRPLSPTLGRAMSREEHIHKAMELVRQLAVGPAED